MHSPYITKKPKFIFVPRRPLVHPTKTEIRASPFGADLAFLLILMIQLEIRVRSTFIRKSENKISPGFGDQCQGFMVSGNVRWDPRHLVKP